MNPSAIVKIKVPSQSDLELASVIVGAQINILVFHAARQPRDEYIVDPARLAIYADTNPGGVDHIGPYLAGELRAPIGLNNLGCYCRKI